MEPSGYGRSVRIDKEKRKPEREREQRKKEERAKGRRISAVAAYFWELPLRQSGSVTARYRISRTSLSSSVLFHHCLSISLSVCLSVYRLNIVTLNTSLTRFLSNFQSCDESDLLRQLQFAWRNKEEMNSFLNAGTLHHSHTVQSRAIMDDTHTHTQTQRETSLRRSILAERQCSFLCSGSRLPSSDWPGCWIWSACAKPRSVGIDATTKDINSLST